ncbi:MAG TPA: 2-oxoacid:ferredoxin oxidoreductase subunit beta [Planctomycetes bacterium]|nr:2-oxoacid:ferredoxin oxidoreductase subunit beta [Planctomycetota bacterium]
MTPEATLTKKDLKSDQEVRWCPGCGDYAILNCVQGVVAKLGIPRENVMFVSGIGCSSRFPYYMNTYGFHTIHGRAPSFASGIKIANPDLSVWIVTGDGDALSIGGNHLIHILRRNFDVNILLFNNEIYGLTKGQYSPTSKRGAVTKASPYGSLDNPFNPISLALGAGATFVARTIDSDQKHMARVLEAAAAHKGTSFVEVYQNCVIFNDGAFDDVADKKVRSDRTVDLVPGEPIVYGKERDKGLRIEGFGVEACAASDASVWNAGIPSPAPAMLFASIERGGELPDPIGIFRSVDAPCYEDDLHAQMAAVTEKKGPGKLEDLIYAGDTWEVK